ncbi:hypothetical protein [Metabacillus sp. RGM 3146]|uniref:hypothetical protein n=1 Tax=Metabacillus sp. RGM 3146 TaxID=3401092 RepID=UPI003B9C6E84
MFKSLVSFLGLLVIVLGISGCGTTHKAESNTAAPSMPDDQTIGTVTSKEQGELTVDYSEWYYRGIDGPIAGTGHSVKLPLADSVTATNKTGKKVALKDIKIGQKLSLVPAVQDQTKWKASKVTLLPMTKKEIWHDFLAEGTTSFQTSVFFEEGKPIGKYDMENLLDKDNPSPFANGGISWVHYEPDYVVDVKKELKISKMPVILIFNQEKEVFRTYKKEEAEKYLNEH